MRAIVGQGARHWKRANRVTTDLSTQRPRKERKENADKRRAQLLDATRRSIVSKGLAKTTLATVAAEAGLSQGVAVFYFKSKTGLLTETLRDHYLKYDQNWKQMLAAAGDDPLEQVMAMIRADFAPAVCGPESLALWFAFWGEEKYTPQYAALSTEFDIAHRDAMRAICARLLAAAPASAGIEVSDWIENVTDGYWQKLHLFPETTTPDLAVAATFRLLARLLPEYADRILAD